VSVGADRGDPRRRVIWFTGREAVERREDGIFVIVGTGVELTPANVGGDLPQGASTA
jgi:hypothetical protein